MKKVFLAVFLMLGSFQIFAGNTWNNYYGIKSMSYWLDNAVFELDGVLHENICGTCEGISTVYLKKDANKELLALMLNAYNNGGSVNIEWICCDPLTNGWGNLNTPVKIHFKK